MSILYLHIGAPKTGTKSIQSFLSKNEAKVRQHGLNYLASGRDRVAQHNLAYELNQNYIRRGRFRQELGTWTQALSELAATPDIPGCVSSEAFFYFPPDCVTKLRVITQHIHVKVIVYLRRQDQWLLSRLNQHARFGRVRVPVQTYATNLIKTAKYDEILAPWIREFGLDNLRIRLYDNIKTGGGTLAHFLGQFAPGCELPSRETAWKHSKAGLKQLVAMKWLFSEFKARTSEKSKLSLKTTMQVSAYFRERPAERVDFTLFNFDLAHKIWSELQKSNENLYEILKNTGSTEVFPAPTPEEYASFVDFDDQNSIIDPEEQAWLEATLARAVALSTGSGAMH